MPAWARLDVGSVENGGTLHVTLVIAQSRRVSGRVIDAEGSPLSGIEVHVYTTAISSAGSVAPDGLSMSGGAVSAQISRRRDRAVVSRVFGTRTKEDGSFGIDVTVDGQYLLVVLPPGRAVVRRDLDPSRTDEAVEVRVGDIGSVGKVTFTWDGEPLADSLVTISDVTLHMQGPQISLRRVETDETGSCSAEWLEVGRTYGFTIRRPRGLTPRSKSFALVWNATDTVEVGPLDLALLDQR